MKNSLPEKRGDFFLGKVSDMPFLPSGKFIFLGKRVLTSSPPGQTSRSRVGLRSAAIEKEIDSARMLEL